MANFPYLTGSPLAMALYSLYLLVLIVLVVAVYVASTRDANWCAWFVPVSLLVATALSTWHFARPVIAIPAVVAMHIGVLGLVVGEPRDKLPRPYPYRVVRRRRPRRWRY
ncbi:hypothetical protein [Yinghuangia sp. YIM S09857]|uniref:hypothetical protein n=1 Tax=Yinghuangia sp. YIM S09857 TaxID=3436929 RepID=UPI003F532B2B